MASFPGQPGKSDHMQIICTTLQTDNHASTPSLNFLWAGRSSWRPTNSVKVQTNPYIILSVVGSTVSSCDILSKATWKGVSCLAFSEQHPCHHKQCLQLQWSVWNCRKTSSVLAVVICQCFLAASNKSLWLQCLLWSAVDKHMPTRSTQPSSLWVQALTGWGKGGTITSARWQVTPCDPIWHVSSLST